MIRFLALLAALAALPASIAWAASTGAVTVQIVDERGVPVRDAVVELETSGWRGGRITFPWRMAMAQRNEQFVPGTLVIARGSTVAFPNLDELRHSVYSFSKPARFQIDLYGRDQTRSHTFPVSGSVTLGCNIHDDMSGYIRVVDTPFAAKTDANGYVTLTGVPSGAATLTVSHPRLRAPGGEMSKSISARGAQKIAVRLR
ncbi:methylamine utilization protein [Erythrobacter sp.]|uniref:methylamine utilization protein n=1 Tax=Erythrobacter sp. TaxID=1042 RepID=UPI0025C2758B|nr:methylamine utilization protein [Erythrobacter sp.]